ncbi:hypothetical protein F4677DRAFT_413167 [Hypoxylon crocopeplum]|nr:hypothetical protein F4677DRAFT_413167 [Hypoxylon crocopeplum]
MRGLQAGGAVLCLSLAGQAALAIPTNSKRAACTELSTTTPNWQISHAASSDWPGGGNGRVELFAHHVPTGETAACDVNYSLNQTSGAIIDFDPSTAFECGNFGFSTSILNTTVQLNMETLVLNLWSSWACEEDEATTYTATGSTTLQRDMSPGACLVEPSQIGESTTCPIADVDVEGKLAEAS